LSAPAYFGEIGLLHAVPRTATVTAEGQCLVWSIEAASFLGAVSQAGMSGALSDTVTVRLAAGHGRGNVISVGTDL
jgi:CRP-like cAMP-binding protein